MQGSLEGRQHVRKSRDQSSSCGAVDSFSEHNQELSEHVSLLLLHSDFSFSLSSIFLFHMCPAFLFKPPLFHMIRIRGRGRNKKKKKENDSLSSANFLFFLRFRKKYVKHSMKTISENSATSWKNPDISPDWSVLLRYEHRCYWDIDTRKHNAILTNSTVRFSQKSVSAR